MELLPGLLPIIVLASTDMVFRIFRAYFNTMPLFVVQRVRRVVADVVLIAQFCRNFIQHVLDFITAIVGPVAGQQPGFAATLVCERLQDIHIHSVGIAASTWILLVLE